MSRLPFELLLALRYLRPKRTFVSVITLISVLGVTLGVAVLIIVISVMSGFDKQMRDKILGFNAHLKVTSVDGTMSNYSLVTSIIRSNRNVTGVTPIVTGQVLVETQPPAGQSLFSAPIMRGLDPASDSSLGLLLTNIIEGNFDLSGHGLVLGSDYAQNMRLSVGDRVSIYSPQDIRKMKENRGKADEMAVLPADYEVRGIFDVGYYEYDSGIIVTSLENAQDMYDVGDTVHSLLVMLDDPYQAAIVRKDLYQTLGTNYSIVLWSEENSAILNALLVEKNVMFYLLIFIVIVAAFGITSALITFVIQKTREIGILKALGATSGQIRWLFMSQSLVIGVVGVSVGFALGMLALTYRNPFLHFMNRATGIDLLPGSVYGFGDLPALIVHRDVYFICGMSLLICLVAGWLPAWTATRLKPVEALRHE